MNDEFITAIDKSELSANTKTTYTANYKRLMRITADKPILCYTQPALIKVLSDVDAPPMSVNGLVSVVFLIRNSVHLSNSKLEKFRKTLYETHYDNKEANNTDVLKDKLVSISDLANYVASRLTAKDYTSFIINYLLLKYGLRNSDVNLTIVKSKTQATDKNINYIYFTSNYVVFVVNDYKTHDIYGTKKFTIKSRPFINVCKILLDDADSHVLIEATNKNAFIQSRTLNKMGSGLMFKSIVSELYSHGEKTKIRKLSLSRGTSISTIEREYTIDISD
tara:strand:+ start:850 stop:1683 length:834 start_codon:yes stop_codon:yes gene_type:complete